MIDETRSPIRAVRRVIDLREALIDIWAEILDELSAIQEEAADEAYLSAAQDKFASAKDGAVEALSLLRRWLKAAEATDDGEAAK